MYARYFDDLDRVLGKNRVLILYGPRQVGKTTLLEKFLQQGKYKYKLDSGDNIRVQEVLGSRDFNRILEYVEGYELIAIDEAQEVPNIGTALKIIIDQSPETIVIATGSSSFELAQKVGEPLTGRKKTIVLYPLSHKELLAENNKHELREQLENFLLFGAYPEVLSQRTRQEKILLLRELVESYLLRDVLAHERIKSPKMLLKLLKLLAFQVGSEVSMNELGTKVGIDTKTVGRYLDLLQKCFVIVPLGGFSRNLRKEVVSKFKYYFLDNGIRNAVIVQFNTLANRNDLGALFENFIVTERLKKQAYENFYGNRYFWRTYSGQEIDLIEEIDGELFAYEMKWSNKKKVRLPKAWTSNYTAASFAVINSENYLDFIL